MESAGEPAHFVASAVLESPASQSFEGVQGEAESPVELDSLCPWKQSPLLSPEDSETEVDAPPVITRKVSFADAFGLNLVSVKEFDTWHEANPLTDLPPDTSGPDSPMDSGLSCLFTVSCSAEELLQKVEAQKVELESLKLLPGTTLLRGTARVLNLCFDKRVYVRISLDGWDSHFDLPAEFAPGSSDGHTDGFSFTLALDPPSEGDQVRVEFCLCYETALGTFWANNGGANYVLFYDKKAAPDMKGRRQEEGNHWNKKSCLKTSREIATEHHLTGLPVEYTDTVENEKDGVTTGVQSGAFNEEHPQKSLAGCELNITRKSRRRMARMARVRDHFKQRESEPVRGEAVAHKKGKVDARVLKMTPSGDAASRPHQSRRETQSCLSNRALPMALRVKEEQNRDFTTESRDPWESFCSADDTVYATALELSTPSCGFWVTPPSCTQASMSQSDLVRRPRVVADNLEILQLGEWCPLQEDPRTDVCGINKRVSDSHVSNRYSDHDQQKGLCRGGTGVLNNVQSGTLVRGQDVSQSDPSFPHSGHMTETSGDGVLVGAPKNPVAVTECQPKDTGADSAVRGEEEYSTEISDSPARAAEISPGELVNLLSEITSGELINLSAEISPWELVNLSAKLNPGELVNLLSKISEGVPVNLSAQISPGELVNNSEVINRVEQVDHPPIIKSTLPSAPNSPGTPLGACDLETPDVTSLWESGDCYREAQVYGEQGNQEQPAGNHPEEWREDTMTKLEGAEKGGGAQEGMQNKDFKQREGQSVREKKLSEKENRRGEREHNSKLEGKAQFSVMCEGFLKAGVRLSTNRGQASHAEVDISMEDGERVADTRLTPPTETKLSTKDAQSWNTHGRTQGSAGHRGSLSPSALASQHMEASAEISISQHAALDVVGCSVLAKVGPSKRTESTAAECSLAWKGLTPTERALKLVLYAVLLTALCVSAYQYGLLVCLMLYLCSAGWLFLHRDGPQLQGKDRAKHTQGKEYRQLQAHGCVVS